MKDPYDVPSSERGVVRLFTTDLDAEGNSAITPTNVHRLLGAELDLDPSRIEVFPSTVIEDMGLSAYLAEGYGIPVDDLQGTTAKLDSIKGLLILVSSGAFKAQTAQLAPAEGIRFVGAFQEPGMRPPKTMGATESSEGHLSPTGPPAPLQSGPRRFWPIALLALLAAAVLILVVVL